LWHCGLFHKGENLMIHSLQLRLAKGLVAAFSASLLLAACGGGGNDASSNTVADDPTASASPDREDALIRGCGPIATRQWMASLQIGSSHICGASLVADGWLLTAAHCVTNAQGNLDRPANSYRVCVGVQRLSDCNGGNVAGVTEIRVHPNWRGAVGNANNGDLALLRVNGGAFANNAKVALASDASHTPGDGGTAIIRGWGRTDSDGPPATLTDELLGLTQTLTSSGCPAGHVCAVATATQGVCNGDSGGPLRAQGGDGTWRQVGITSYVSTRQQGACAAAGPDGYTRVASYADWIQGNTGAAL
jgi:Trypsin